MSDLYKYIFGHPDLALWFSRTGDYDALAEHLIKQGPNEGRFCPDKVIRPLDWSDTLFNKFDSHNDVRNLLNLGVIDTNVYRAAVLEENQFPVKGRVSRNTSLLEKSQLPASVLEQLVECETDNGIGRTPLSAIIDDKLYFTPLPSLVISALKDYCLQHDFHGRHWQVAILVPWLESGGAELGAYWFYRGAEALGFKPVLVLPDKPNITEFFSNKNLDIINIPEIVSAKLKMNYDHIPLEIRINLLNDVLTEIDVSVIHLVHSWVGYNLFASPSIKGTDLASKKLLVSAFCPHVHTSGKIDGYYRYIPALDEVTAAFLFDNQWYLDEIRGMFTLEVQRLNVVPYPVVLPDKIAAREWDHPIKILWASRMDHQKNPTIVFDIARRLPDFQFEMYGRVVLSDTTVNWSDAPPNVVYKGEFFGFNQLPRDIYHVFLYTSLFDGMPNIVLEAAAAGMPIVSSAVGGIPEFLDSTMGHIVSDAFDVEGYVAALSDLCTDSERLASASNNARLAADQYRSFNVFIDSMKKIPIYNSLISQIIGGSQ